MGLMTSRERAFCRAVSGLIRSNPFLPERIALEREILGSDFAERKAVWSVRADVAWEDEHPNIPRIAQACDTLAESLRARLAEGKPAGEEELILYQDLVLYLLYYRSIEGLSDFVIKVVEEGRGGQRVECFRDFARHMDHFFHVPEVNLPTEHDPAHIFACFCQVRRAFHLIFRSIVGGSMPMARLRAAIWESVFTHDLRRYLRSLYDRMGDVSTLIIGPSGTGKELVARAIGLSRYVPFDPERQTFRVDVGRLFHALSVSALSPTLVESELFGHRRGAFTGAVEDRAGWMEVCPDLGAIFLDEVGDIAPAIQVKLLRVLQTRTFQRLGDTEPRRFRGKVVAATNRDLMADIEAGSFRRDFYYRLCSDIVTTPSLAEQLRDSPDELGNMLLFIAQRVAGAEAERLAREVESWILGNLGPDYPWPGNFRELEQCVMNVLVRKEYRPPVRAGRGGGWVDALRAGELTAEEVLRRYCALVYERTGSYSETARRLGLDRRTVRARVAALAEAEDRGTEG